MLFIPSINQLRYAGYHIVRSLLNDDEKELQAERVKAINHVKRAIYDTNNLWSSPASLASIFFAKIIVLQAFDFFGNVLSGLIATALQVYATF
jgi:hypothetical protein